MMGDMTELEKKFTKYEIARILGARALQIAMDAPLLIKISREEMERVKYDPLIFAEMELRGEVLPITINRPMPIRAEKELAAEVDKVDDKKIEETAEREEEEIKEGAEIMELANPDDEFENEGSDEDAGGEVE
jgi:DNA-directed RNA polymerase subunit K